MGDTKVLFIFSGTSLALAYGVSEILPLVCVFVCVCAVV